ncbi:MAG: tetraacyldisaccharide 4'-kinase [Rhizomicrobium sp.]
MHAPDFWRRRNWRERRIGDALTPLGWLYSAAVALKAARTKVHHASVPVICVGNLTAGGTGKTPVSIAIARMLGAHGHNPFFVTRGYGGKLTGPLRVMAEHRAADVGDEPLLLADTAPTIVARVRAAGAGLATALGAGVIVMDDGHQHFSLHKDLSLVVIDTAQQFGNGRVLPAGPLRERVKQGLKRADAVILVGDTDVDLPHLLPHFTGPVLRAHIRASDNPELSGARMFGFAGIGLPEKFFRSLEAAGAILAGAKCFADHHTYSAAEIASLKATARDRGAQLITTAKDYVRLTPDQRDGIRVLPVEAEFDDPASLERLIGGLWPEQKAS